MRLDDKTIVVTGADGFIGSHLVELLVARAKKVRALTYYNSSNDWGWLEQQPFLRDIEVVPGDVRDAEFCRRLVNGADLVFHLAALIGIPYSYRAPASYVDVNVIGTLNMCRAASEAGCIRFVHTSTSEVYGTAKYAPIDEQHPLQPQSPYSASKIGADMIAQSYRHSFNLPVVTARPFNTYGPRQSARAVIPTLIGQLCSGASEIRVGDLRPTRDFNFVEDTCRGFAALAECDAAVGEVVNIGSDTEISMRDLFYLLRNLTGSSAEPVIDPARIRPEGSEVMRLRCDSRKMVALTGHKPQVALAEGLRRTAEWFRVPGNLARYKTSLYNV